MQHEINRGQELVVKVLQDDGTFPNNSRLPLLLRRGAFRFQGKGSPILIEATFAENKWTGSWRNGIYPIHHYHSTAHEVLGVYAGNARVQFGGENGPILTVSAGDVVVIPAGVAHKNIQSSFDFRVVGAYPEGQTWDMNYGKEGERPDADRNIKNVPDPKTDPVSGRNGPLMEAWKK